MINNTYTTDMSSNITSTSAPQPYTPAAEFTQLNNNRGWDPASSCNGNRCPLPEMSDYRNVQADKYKKHFLF